MMIATPSRVILVRHEEQWLAAAIGKFGASRMVWDEEAASTIDFGRDVCLCV
jgi:hypothetical protein